MKVIFGLGNPELKYENTRHNAGFKVIDNLLNKYNITSSKEECHGIVYRGEIEGKKVILIKPQTYMNLSGECVLDFINYYKTDLSDIIVVYDDIDIEIGKIRVRKSGSAGTHNGMRNIIEMLGSKEFTRVRVGTDKPSTEEDLADYVLRKLTKEEAEKLDEGINLASEAVIELIKTEVQ